MDHDSMSFAWLWNTLGAYTAQYTTSWIVTHVVLIVALSAITIYRREMSCNHCYAANEVSTEAATASADDGWSIAATSLNNNNNNNNSNTDNNNTSTNSKWLKVDEEETEELLENVGNYCSGASLVPVWSYLCHKIWKYKQRRRRRTMSTIAATVENSDTWSLQNVLDATDYLASILYHHPPMAITIPSEAKISSGTCVKSNEYTYSPNPITVKLPLDAQLHVFSFLHPRDIVATASVDRSLQTLVSSDHSNSDALWKTIWKRDYAWVVEKWSVGNMALKRSMGLDVDDDDDDTLAIIARDMNYCKQFYMEFAMSYLDFVLAGHDTYEDCLLGIQGHIYDCSLFVAQHPGSPETLLVNAGRDATGFFAGIRHSNGARQLAQTMGLVADLTQIDPQHSCGLRPTKLITEESLADEPRYDEVPLMTYVSEKQSVLSTQFLYRKYTESKKSAIAYAKDRYAKESLFGEAHVYFDPFTRQWKAWYTDCHLEVFHVHLTES